MLNTIGTISGLMAIMINVVAFAGALPLSTRGRITLAAGTGLWAGLATQAASSGALAVRADTNIPWIGVFFALPLILTAVCWNSSKTFRDALLGIPISLLVGLNSMRMIGALFLGLIAVGRLSGPFPYSAGIGDIITGIIAMRLALALAHGSTSLDSSIRLWNIFGAIDLFAAVFFGLTSAQGSPLQIFHVGAGSEAMQFLPFALVPTVLVPFYLITHAIIAAQLRERRRAQTIGDRHLTKGVTV